MRKRTLYTYVCQVCGSVRTCYRKEQTATPCYACAAQAHHALRRVDRGKAQEAGERVCTSCGYPLIDDPEVIVEYGPECGDCGGPARSFV